MTEADKKFKYLRYHIFTILSCEKTWIYGTLERLWVGWLALQDLCILYRFCVNSLSFLDLPGDSPLILQDLALDIRTNCMFTLLKQAIAGLLLINFFEWIRWHIVVGFGLSLCIVCERLDIFSFFLKATWPILFTILG